MKNKTAINLFLFISILLTQLTFGIPPAQAAATITVTTSADDIIVDTFCSLREAIMNANSNNTTHADCNAGNGSDKILFADDITTITLSGTLPNINDSSELTIDGDGHITIDGSNTFRIMFLTSLGGFSLKNITLKNGGCTSCGGGGAILMIGTFSSINISNVIFLGNRQALYIQDFSASGVVHITDSQFINNTASSLSGGAINLESGSVIIQNSLFFGNTASNAGGAVYTRGNTTITNSSFANNVSPYGGAIYSDSSPVLTVTRSSFTDNHASGQGGGIYTYYENVNTFIANNTFSGNTAEAGGAIIGFASSTGAATLSNNTISGNSATVIGGGIYNTGNRISIYNNIISDNGGGDCTISDGSTVPGSNNLIKSLSHCGFNNGENGNIIGSDPNLGSLTGSPAYFPLNTGSPAIDAANNAICAANPVNNQSQNGITRPQGGHCDIGSYETPGNSLTSITSITRASTNPTSAASVNYTVTFSEAVQNVDINDFALTTTGVTGASITNVSGSSSTRTITVNTGSGNGTIRLDVPNTATISDLSSNALSGLPFTTGEVYSIDKSGGPLPSSPTFSDVPMSHPYWADIEILYANGFTGGCSANPLLFCPETTMDRAQGAVFMLRGLVGTSYVPPVEPFANPFGDSWAPGPWAQRWAQGMLDQGLTAGCSVLPLLYCPWEQMPRAQAAVFGMRLLNGSAYLPPTGTGTVFADINGSEWYAGWAEQAYLNGLLPACGSSGGRPLFCPNSLVSRGLAAYMIVRAKNLSMP